MYYMVLLKVFISSLNNTVIILGMFVFFQSLDLQILMCSCSSLLVFKMLKRTKKYILKSDS